MKIHEYQGKALFRQYGIATPKGDVCFSASEADTLIDSMDTNVWVVKAQIHAGGRGKGGGVKVTTSPDDAKAMAREILGMRLITHQTGRDGQTVRRLLIESGMDIAKEFYMALVIDREKQQIVLMLSSEGGMDIENVAAKTPEKILKMWIPISSTINKNEAYELAKNTGLPDSVLNQAVEMMENALRLFIETDAALVEVNPLVVTHDNQLFALDSKINFDDNAAFRHPEYETLMDKDEEDSTELEAAAHDLSYISLDGNIGCMVNGAGLAMATMDIIKLYGGEPANFLDVGGGATAEKVSAAFKLMLANKKVRAILINIFGGIMRCDIIAKGVVTATREIMPTVPIIVRLEGTNAEEGKRILNDSGLSILTADSMADAAKKVVAVTIS